MLPSQVPEVNPTNPNVKPLPSPIFSAYPNCNTGVEFSNRDVNCKIVFACFSVTPVNRDVTSPSTGAYVVPPLVPPDDPPEPEPLPDVSTVSSTPPLPPVPSSGPQNPLIHTRSPGQSFQVEHALSPITHTPLSHFSESIHSQLFAHAAPEATPPEPPDPDPEPPDPEPPDPEPDPDQPPPPEPLGSPTAIPFHPLLDTPLLPLKTKNIITPIITSVIHDDITPPIIRALSAIYNNVRNKYLEKIEKPRFKTTESIMNIVTIKAAINEFVQFINKDPSLVITNVEMEGDTINGADGIPEELVKRYFEQKEGQKETCISVLTRGKNKGGFCGKLVVENGMCKTHFKTIKNTIKCLFILTKGKNKGVNCGKSVNKEGETYCKTHLSIVEESIVSEESVKESKVPDEDLDEVPNEDLDEEVPNEDLDEGELGYDNGDNDDNDDDDNDDDNDDCEGLLSEEEEY